MRQLEWIWQADVHGVGSPQAPSRARRRSVITALAIVGFVAPTLADPIPYASIGPNSVDFEDVVGEQFPQIAIYDGILVSGNVKFAERFVGQTLSIEPPISDGGPVDVLSGMPGAHRARAGTREFPLPEGRLSPLEEEAR